MKAAATRDKAQVTSEVGYRRLQAFQKADELAVQVYRATATFPKDEVYGLTSQLRRAVLSVPTNIAEGHGRQGQKELRQFIHIALGSLAEVEYLLGFTQRLGYLAGDEYDRLKALRAQVGRLLWGFERKLREQ